MVRDNINLLERRAPVGLASPFVRRAILLSATLVALGALVYLMQIRHLHALRQQLARVRTQSDRLQRTIAEVPSPEVALADRLASQEREVQAQEAVAHTVSTGGLAHTAGFVDSLQAFGRATTEGVWLTGLRLDNRRGSMVLEGRALDAARVPALLQTLRAEPYFAGTTFSAIEMTAGTASSALAADRALKFRISTPTADLGTPDPTAQAGAAMTTPNRSPL